MAKAAENSKEYIQELEDKIVDLSLKLKSKTNEIKAAEETTTKILGKLIHNLRNPVGVIFSFSEMMLEDLEDYSTEKLEKHLQIIKNSSTFSLMLLETISKYLRVKSPTFILKSQRVNYIELLSGILNEFKIQASEKNIDLVVKFSTDVLFLILDEVEITETIRNILNNALRYSNENTTITVTVTEHKNTVETEITDQGIGISEADLPNIFEPFFVVNTYSSDKQKCIGLGLPTTKKIIEQHKGKILVKSTLEKGSSFNISLPKK
ncbi:MAG: sensor histidine kinase [Lutibacter sp.]